MQQQDCRIYAVCHWQTCENGNNWEVSSPIPHMADCARLELNLPTQFFSNTEATVQLSQLSSWDAPDNTLTMQAFEWHVPDDHAHWRRLRKALLSLKTIGVDHMWLPPGCKAMSPSGNGYDVYDLYDLGEFEQKGSRATKWGTREELHDLIFFARDLGIGIYWDAVLNHKAGADCTERFAAVRVSPRGNVYNSFDFPCIGVS